MGRKVRGRKIRTTRQRGRENSGQTVISLFKGFGVFARVETYTFTKAIQRRLIQLHLYRLLPQVMTGVGLFLLAMIVPWFFIVTMKRPENFCNNKKKPIK
jgi:hypothetical protein